MKSVEASHQRHWEGYWGERQQGEADRGGGDGPASVQKDTGQALDRDWCRRANRFVRGGWDLPSLCELDGVARFGDGYYAIESSLRGDCEKGSPARKEGIGVALWERMKANQPGFNQEEWRRPGRPAPERIGPLADSRNYLIGTDYQDMPTLEEEQAEREAAQERSVAMAAQITRLRCGVVRGAQRGSAAPAADAGRWLHET